MTKRTVVIRKQSLNWQPNTKRKIQPKVSSLSSNNEAGFISPVFIVLACALFSGLFYVYSINQAATKGLAIRSAENEINQKKNDNEALKIKEAELKSLYHIEESTKDLNMVTSQNIKYIEENSSVAFAANQNKN